MLVENDEIISEDRKIAESLNSFFSNIVKNLKIPEYKSHNDSLFENVSDPILTVILKYRNHPSILAIGDVCKNKSNKQPLFSFSQATRDEILKYELLLAKLHAYGFNISALRLMYSYLTNRKQKTMISSSYSSWEESISAFL